MSCKNEKCACKNPKTSATHMREVTEEIMGISASVVARDEADWITVPMNDNYVNTFGTFNAVPLEVATILVKKLGNFVALPEYKTEGSVGMDLYAAENIFIGTREVHIIPTGIAIAIPPGYEGQVRARSGLAVKGLIVVNGPGTIDSDYRGEVKVLLASIGAPYPINRGDRIAQLVIAPVTRAVLQIVDNLDETIRNTGGFGSTGS
jgi:dUTP pyrophosphatase